MRHVIYSIVLVVCSLLVVGCNGDGDPSDTERLIGTWVPWYVGDEGGEKTDDFLSATDKFYIRFRPDQTFFIEIKYNAAGEAEGYHDVALSGPFSTSENPRTLRFDIYGTTGRSLKVSFNFDSGSLLMGGPADELSQLISGPALNGVFELGLEPQ